MRLQIDLQMSVFLNMVTLLCSCERNDENQLALTFVLAPLESPIMNGSVVYSRSLLPLPNCRSGVRHSRVFQAGIPEYSEPDPTPSSRARFYRGQRTPQGADERMIIFSTPPTRKNPNPPRKSNGQTQSGIASLSNRTCSGGA